MRRRKQMFNSTLLAGALVALLATPTLMAQRKGKGGGVKPGNVAAILQLPVQGSAGGIYGDDRKSERGFLDEYAHRDLAPQGGWVNFPGTGNLTLQTRKTSREIVYDFSLDLFKDGEILGLPGGCNIQVDTDARDDFLAILDEFPVLTLRGFMSLNSQDGVSLEGMSLATQSALASLASNFKVGKTGFFLRCGPQGGSNVDDFCGMPNHLEVTCSRHIDIGPDGETKCVEWDTSIKLPPPPDIDKYAVFRCRLFESSRGNRFVIGDFDMPVGLKFFRDANLNGVPDGDPLD